LSGRFVKGRSGNPSGRPQARRPDVSAYDIIFDKVLTATQNGVERELSIDEALELQTYQAALKGNRMAVRSVLKMIEKREAALRQASPPPMAKPALVSIEYRSVSANEAMTLLDIIAPNPANDVGDGPRKELVRSWAAQAAISRPGRTKLNARDANDLHLFVEDADKLRWPKVRAR
jgi:Family of unknown function (DUF5681)